MATFSIFRKNKTSPKLALNTRLGVIRPLEGAVKPGFINSPVPNVLKSPALRREIFKLSLLSHLLIPILAGTLVSCNAISVSGKMMLVDAPKSSQSPSASPSPSITPLSTDATLSALMISGITLSPAFAATTMSYTATIVYEKPTLLVTVKPAANQANATVTINGITTPSGSGQSVSLKYGSNTITLVVTAQDGSTSSTYTVTVTRIPPSTDATLSALTLSSGTLSPSFASSTTSYTTSVTNLTASVTVTPTVHQANATVTVNGTTTSPDSGQSVSLNVGTNTITTVVTAQDGLTTTTYTTTVTRAAPSTDATLSALTLSSGTLSPSFASGTTSYTASVTNATTSVTVTPTVNQANATLKVNGTTQSSGSGQSASLNVGSNTITIVVTAQDRSTTKTYTTSVIRLPSSDATLSAFTLSSGTLSPSFASGTTSYTASVTNATANVTVTPTVNQPNATVTVNGTTTSSGSGQSVSLNVGSNTITTIVSAQDGSTTGTYTTTINRGSSDATLSALTMNSGVIVPTFVSGTTSYSNFIPGVTSVTVTPTVNQANATVKVNGTSVTSGSPSSALTMTDGLNTITILVTAEDGSTLTYTINAYSNQAIVTTLAGTAATDGYVDGTGTAAQFSAMGKIAISSTGNLYAPDRLNNVIRIVTPAGVVTTFAGSGATGSANGTGTAATFNNLASCAFDSSGNLYVTEMGNNLIRKITPGGVVSTFAGSGSPGNTNGTGTAASFNGANDVVVDSSNNVFVSDFYNNLIRKITPAGVVTTFAGSGSAGSTNGTGVAASFNAPTNMGIDSSNNIYLGDSHSQKIRKITPAGVVSTFAGSGSTGWADGTGAAATFYYPSVGSVDPSGNVYVGDYTYHLIRRISPSGVVTTLAGTVGVHSATDGTGLAAQFYNPTGPTVDAYGNLYVPDSNNRLIRVIK